MSPSFTLSLYDTKTGTSYNLSHPSTPGSIVVLDDGWTPAIARIVRDGMTTYGDVVEDIECMTNVATRNAALNLIESLIEVVERAAWYVADMQPYSVVVNAKAQYSTASSVVQARVLGPPPDGTVVQLYPDIGSSPPGQLRFRFRFTRRGGWTPQMSPLSVVANATLNAATVYKTPVVSLPNATSTPMHVQLFIKNPLPTTTKIVSRMYIATDIDGVYQLNTATIASGGNAQIQSVSPSWLASANNVVYVFDSIPDEGIVKLTPQGGGSIAAGRYACFVTYRSRGGVHALRLRFSNNVETAPVIISNSNPDIAHLGVVTFITSVTDASVLAIVGAPDGFEIDQIILLRLHTTSVIIELTNVAWTANSSIAVHNHPFVPFQHAAIGSRLLHVTDSLDVVARAPNFVCAILAVEPSKYALASITTIPITVYYRPTRRMIA